MHNLFEKFVAKGFQANLPNHLMIEEQYPKPIDVEGSQSFRIDLVIRNQNTNQIIAVLDTKYKAGQNPETQDVTEIAAYALSLKTEETILIYPSHNIQEKNYDIGDK